MHAMGCRIVFEYQQKGLINDIMGACIQICTLQYGLASRHVYTTSSAIMYGLEIGTSSLQLVLKSQEP